MAESITQRLGASAMSGSDERELRALLLSVQTDLANIATQFNQLRTDYNANAAIDTNTTATAITLNTTV